MLSVSISGTPDRPVDWLSLVGTLFDPTRTIVPLDALFPEGLTSEQRTEQNASMMSASQLSATAAALKRLGEPVEPRLRVVGVDEAGPSAGVLREGDAIRRADDEPVTGLEELREVLGRAAPGRAVRLEIMRDDAIEQVDVEPETGADGTRLLGVTVTEDYSSPSTSSWNSTRSVGRARAWSSRSRSTIS
ncbi:PDZ domain-containing protein [Leucobacter soli]|uniref:PDZ domain-containing protein n=1 Tax=Leucobacter soli TaxID=2812850 RepID=UPI00361E1E48